ncbi:hypothetical protein [Streptomyces sp. NBC_00083]|uniref:hypothetical protein n=1 Tax=Streptomyces sp. NBC_00083 TaxID=2975647 RepID=UPI0022535369|nr:hypothetical protein [Streptomyces sp. NBC_00083]MCX5387509.1 hypothetical protein [Streptomyces sp. NBC_00083]
MEEYQAHQLERTRAVIRQLEAEQERWRERDKKRRIEVSWKLQPSRADGGVALLHRANRGLYAKEIGYLNAMEAQIHDRAGHRAMSGVPAAGLTRESTGDQARSCRAPA